MRPIPVQRAGLDALATSLTILRQPRSRRGGCRRKRRRRARRRRGPRHLEGRRDDVLLNGEIIGDPEAENALSLLIRAPAGLAAERLVLAHPARWRSESAMAAVPSRLPIGGSAIVDPLRTFPKPSVLNSVASTARSRPARNGRWRLTETAAPPCRERPFVATATVEARIRWMLAGPSSLPRGLLFGRSDESGGLPVPRRVFGQPDLT
jgi:hypothetical protein